nr:hypothetical protein CFP56_40295 [Quercus suber]
MELFELVDRTAKISCLDIRLELPPNQASPCQSQNNLPGTVIEVDFVGEGDSGWKRFTKIMVDVDISKPLIPRVFLPWPKLSDLWISLKYEKIANVCYKCGLIGHDEKFCHDECFVLENPHGISFRAAGPWLRAENSESPHGLYNAVHTMCPPPSVTGKDTNASANENVVVTPLTHPLESESLSDDVEKITSGLPSNLTDSSLVGPSSPNQPDKHTKPFPNPTSSQLESPDHFTSPLNAHSLAPTSYDHNDPLSYPHLNPTTKTSLPCSPLTRNWKITQEEFAFFSKRLKKTICSPEPVFFDLDTTMLIPQSKLEFFILSEREKTSARPTKIHGKITQIQGTQSSSFSNSSKDFFNK